MTVDATAHVVVIGGGITGLAAAFFLRDKPVRVTVLEGSPRLGGKLSASDIAGVTVDEGAEALLAKRPEGVDLVSAVGLGDDLVPARVTSSAIYTRGALRPLPRRQFMGVPADLDELAASGVVSAEGVARAGRESPVPASAGDVSVTEYVGSRLGAEVVDRLVDPLLGGVYAGRSEDLSFRATLAPLAAAAGKYATLTEAAAALLPAPGSASQDNSNRPPAAAPPAGHTSTGPAGYAPASTGPAGQASTETARHAPTQTAGQASTGPARHTPTGPAGRAPTGPASAASPAAAPAPVFVSLTTGLGALPEAVAKASGADIRTNAMVRELKRTQSGWRLTIGSAAAPEYLDADAVILATPPAPAARLLRDSAGAAATRLAEIPQASMAIVTLAFRAKDFPERHRSGYLVPAVDGRAVKAATFSTVKWPHLAAQAQGQVQVVRCSVGRSGDVAALQRDDKDLAALAAVELSAAVGLTAPSVAWRVTRWGGGLPQYNVGHLDRVADIRAAVAAQPGLAIAGAAYDGVGIPACIATAKSAATQITAYLSTSRSH